MNSDLLADEIRQLRGSDTIVRFRVIVDRRKIGYEELDSLAQSLGLKGIGRYWREIRREGAITLATAFLTHDLAYHAQLMPDERSADLARRFISSFADDARFFTNSGYSTGSTSWSWAPLTESTFDAGILAVSDSLVGVLVVQDED